MESLRIKFDFSHGPIWKDKYDTSTGEWTTGIDIIDNDKALSVLNEEAGKEYSSLYYFDNDGILKFDSQSYEAKKGDLLSLVQTIILRINDLGTFEIIDEASKKLTQ